MTSPIHTPPPELGAILRETRQGLGLTLDALAERSGVSKSMVSQLERGLVNPTFAVVWSLTQALGLDIADLDRSGGGRDSLERIADHMPAYATPVKSSEDGKVQLRLLSPKRTVLPAEWYDVIFEPGGHLDSEPHAKGTYEHLHCIEGALEVSISNAALPVESGATLRYYADRAHTIANPGDGRARAFLVIGLPTQFRGQP